MRPQQKNFVVEIKSKGRRSAVRQGSIWGTTDLKALARQAAGIAPQLFDDAQKANASVGVGQSGFENAVPPAGIIPEKTPGSIEATTPIEEATSREQPILAAAEPDPVTEAVEKATPSRRPRKAAKVTADRTDGLADAVASLTKAGSTDELEMLERENRILRGEFAARLRQENSWLRSMLERF